MHALKVLEFDQIRVRLADQCETELGRALAADLMPLFDEDHVWILLAQTGEALGLVETARISLVGARDVGPQVKHASKGAILDGEVLSRIGRTIKVSREASEVLDHPDIDALAPMRERLGSWPVLEQTLADSLDSDGSVLSSASQTLASARASIQKLTKRLQERIQSYTSGRFRTLLSDPIYTQRSGRYVVPLKAENRGKIKGIVHDTSASGQTIFVEPEEIVKLGNELREAEATERSETQKVLKELSGACGDESEAIIESTEALGDLDLILAKARLGLESGSLLPLRIKGPAMVVEHGRHPLLDRKEAVPLTLTLGWDYDAILITGPNTGGKTVAIKTLGLYTAMAQAGLMIPAEVCKFGCFSQIWADIGDEQSLEQSLSTFSGHIKNIGTALKAIKPGALVLLDEAGAGTDPTEGASLARALLLEFKNRGAKILASTHYGELKVFASTEPGFVNASMDFDRKTLAPTYRLQIGTPGSSHALKIAQRYGIPKDVIEEAERGLSVSERDIAKMIESLEESQRRAREAQSRADRLAAELDKVQQEAEEKADRADEARRKVRREAADELSEVLREIRLEAAEIFEFVKANPGQEGMDEARKKLKQLQEVGREFVKEVKPEEKPPTPVEAAKIIKGSKVRIRSLNQTGIVLSNPKGGKVEVQAGPMKMQVKLKDLVLVGEPAKPKAPKSDLSIRTAKKDTTSFELHLRMLRAEEAKEALEQFLDDAILASAPFVRIVHGKGGGTLRKVTREVLRTHAHIGEVRDGLPHEGGQGVTIATLD
jgi:DNA mismatch repair protein MutS2